MAVRTARISASLWATVHRKQGEIPGRKRGALRPNVESTGATISSHCLPAVIDFPVWGGETFLRRAVGGIDIVVVGRLPGKAPFAGRLHSAVQYRYQCVLQPVSCPWSSSPRGPASKGLDGLAGSFSWTVSAGPLFCSISPAVALRCFKRSKISHIRMVFSSPAVTK